MQRLPIVGPYARARDWNAAPNFRRERISQARASDYRRIARLGDAWGEELDRLGCSYRIVRWVAGASGPLLIAERERRYRAVVELMRRGPAPPGAFERLMSSRPRVGSRWRGDPVRPMRAEPLPAAVLSCDDGPASCRAGR